MTKGRHLFLSPTSYSVTTQPDFLGSSALTSLLSLWLLAHINQMWGKNLTIHMCSTSLSISHNRGSLLYPLCLEPLTLRFRVQCSTHWANWHYAEATITTPSDKWLICLTKKSFVSKDMRLCLSQYTLILYWWTDYEYLEMGGPA